jgi:hypothetical protein
VLPGRNLLRGTCSVSALVGICFEPMKEGKSELAHDDTAPH